MWTLSHRNLNKTLKGSKKPLIKKKKIISQSPDIRVVKKLTTNLEKGTDELICKAN